MEKILVAHVESHVSQTITRLLREIGVFSEMIVPDLAPDSLDGVRGVIVAQACGDAPAWVPSGMPVLFTVQADRTAIETFVRGACGSAVDWKAGGQVEAMVQEIAQSLPTQSALAALSGGVDSTVSAVLVHRAIGERLVCFFIDTGLMRLNEGDQVMAMYERLGLKVRRIDAEERFLTGLRGVTEPEKKRKIIGETFVRVFEEAAKQSGATALVQGTIYPDILESGMKGKDVVKSHHNVGGMPEEMGFTQLVEPLKLLFKDEVRQVGAALGLDDAFVHRQPFPGPGLGVRCVGELTKPRLDTLRAADAIFREEVDAAVKRGETQTPWQYFAVLTGVRSTGVRAGVRTYGEVVALRAIDSIDAMTAACAGIPLAVFKKACNRICDEVAEVGRVVVDITDKPPGTIEWE